MDNTRSTKTRSEVNRTTKKLYKQKGTGGARHGSRRAPIFVGGGVTFGPRPERRILSLPQALRVRSKAYALSLKANNKEIVAVSGISKLAKTKEMGELLKKLTDETKARRFTILLSEKTGPIFKFLRNIKDLETVSFKDANAFDIWDAGLLILDEDIFMKEEKSEKKQKTEIVKKVAKKSK